MANPDFCVIQAEDVDIFFTVTESYNIARSATVTEYNVESGQKITDHHTADNKMFKFSGVVSLAEVVGGGYDVYINPDRVVSALDELISTGETFTFLSDSELLGSISLTPNCILTNYDINRDASLGDGIEITVDIREIQFINSLNQPQTIAAPAVENRAEKENKGGKRGTVDTNDYDTIIKEKEESLGNLNQSIIDLNTPFQGE